jgi:hypothetical protein
VVGLVTYEEGTAGPIRTRCGELLLDDPRWVVIHADDRTHILGARFVIDISITIPDPTEERKSDDRSTTA